MAMNRFYNYRAVAILLLIGAAPALADDGDDRFVAFQNEIVHEINKQRQAYSEDIRRLQEQRNALISDFQAYGEVIRVLKDDVTALHERVKALEEENATLRDQNSTKLEELRNLIIAESRSRRKSYEKVIAEVSSEISNIEKRAISTAPPAPSFQIYRVEKGDTLGAIAKAFDVPLPRLKALNDLAGDTIYVGQQLKIPEDK